MNTPTAILGLLLCAAIWATSFHLGNKLDSLEVTLTELGINQTNLIINKIDSISSDLEVAGVDEEESL